MTKSTLTTTTTADATTKTRSTASTNTSKVFVSSKIEVATEIVYLAALSNTSSAEYKTQSQNIEKIFQSELKTVATDNGMTLDSVTVLFTESTSRRNRRSTTSDTIITAVYSTNAFEFKNLTSLEVIITSLVTTAAETAISNSAGTYVIFSTIPVVITSVLNLNATTTPTSSTRISTITTTTTTPTTPTTQTTTTATTITTTTPTTITTNPITTTTTTTKTTST